MDLNIKIPALEKLLDYTASGIGSVAGSMLATWQADRDARARLVAAKGERETQKLLAEGRADTMQIIAAAQADARSALMSPDAVLLGTVDIPDIVSQRIQFQEAKRQTNIGSVVRRAARQLGDIEIQDHEVDHDWTARFFSDVQDVSSGEMQQLWAKVLAGEVERPGSTSVKTIGILKNLDKTTASLFQKLCSVCVSVSGDGITWYDSRVLFLGSYGEGNALRDYGLDFGNLNVLSEHRLIRAEYNSWHDYVGYTGVAASGAQSIVYFPLSFQNKYWILMPIGARVQRTEFKLSGVALTESGRELSRVIDLVPEKRYTLNLIEYLRGKKLEMTEVPSWGPHIV